VEEITGHDIPDALQDATDFMFAVMAFLLLYVNERYRGD
jgi:hypothetical protein